MKAADTVRRREKREEMQNTARGYRTKGCPTGEEMNNIIKFWFNFISDNFGEYNRILETRVKEMEEMIGILETRGKRMEKMIAIAALAATNAAIVGLLIKVKLCSFSRNQ